LSTLPAVIRVSEQERLKYLQMMRRSLSVYHEAIKTLISVYKAMDVEIADHLMVWPIPPSTYINFRDALCHYAAACHHEEAFQLLQERNAMEEHLHRATKDLAVHYLQSLGHRLEAVFSYEEQPEDSIPPDGIGNITADCDLCDIVGRLSQEDREDDEKIQRVKSFLRYYFVRFHKGHRELLQKQLHIIRNFDLFKRRDSLKIKRPYCPEELEKFHKTVKECQNALSEVNLLTLVAHFGNFFINESDEVDKNDNV